MSIFTAKKKRKKKENTGYNANIKVELKEKGIKQNRATFIKKCKFTRNVIHHKLMCPVTHHSRHGLKIDYCRCEEINVISAFLKDQVDKNNQ